MSAAAQPEPATAPPPAPRKALGPAPAPIRSAPIRSASRPPAAGGPSGSPASTLLVSQQEGRSLGTSNGAVLLQGLCAEATVRPDEASGGIVLGLRCDSQPADFLEVAVGKVRGTEQCVSTWHRTAAALLQRTSLDGCFFTESISCAPPTPNPTPTQPYSTWTAALPPLPGARPRQAVLDGASLGRPLRGRSAGGDAVAVAAAGGAFLLGQRVLGAGWAVCSFA